MSEQPLQAAFLHRMAAAQRVAAACLHRDLPPWQLVSPQTTINCQISRSFECVARAAHGIQVDAPCAPCSASAQVSEHRDQRNQSHLVTIADNVAHAMLAAAIVPAKADRMTTPQDATADLVPQAPRQTATPASSATVVVTSSRTVTIPKETRGSVLRLLVGKRSRSLLQAAAEVDSDGTYFKRPAWVDCTSQKAKPMPPSSQAKQAGVPLGPGAKKPASFSATHTQTRLATGHQAASSKGTVNGKAVPADSCRKGAAALPPVAPKNKGASRERPHWTHSHTAVHGVPHSTGRAAAPDPQHYPRRAKDTVQGAASNGYAAVPVMLNGVPSAECALQGAHSCVGATHQAGRASQENARVGRVLRQAEVCLRHEAAVLRRWFGESQAAEAGHQPLAGMCGRGGSRSNTVRNSSIDAAMDAAPLAGLEGSAAPETGASQPSRHKRASWPGALPAFSLHQQQSTPDGGVRPCSDVVTKRCEPRSGPAKLFVSTSPPHPGGSNEAWAPLGSPTLGSPTDSDCSHSGHWPEPQACQDTERNETAAEAPTSLACCMSTDAPVDEGAKTTVTSNSWWELTEDGNYGSTCTMAADGGACWLSSAGCDRDAYDSTVDQEVLAPLTAAYPCSSQAINTSSPGAIAMVNNSSKSSMHRQMLQATNAVVDVVVNQLLQDTWADVEAMCGELAEQLVLAEFA